MRSHAKASSAGSNPGRGASLDSTRRGALATPASSLDAEGSGAPSGRLRLPLLLAVAATFFLFAAGQASAAGTITIAGAPGGTGEGTITITHYGTSTDPLNCHVVGATASGDCTTHAQSSFEEVEFHATPEGGASFGNWEFSGESFFNSCEGTTNATCEAAFGESQSATLKAKFEAPHGTITIAGAPGGTGEGTITITHYGTSTDPLNCHVVGATASGDCTTHAQGFFEEVEFHATPEGGASFGNWEFSGESFFNSCEGTTNATCEAAFGESQSAILMPEFAAATPSVSTEAANAVGVAAATLNGKVNPNSIAVEECNFQYVTEAAFQATGFTDLSSGGSSACVPSPGSGSGFVAVSASVGGLDPGTTYRFRIVATNTNGSGEGSAFSFTTEPAVKDLSTNPATSVAPYAATLNGSLDPDGAPITDCHFEYVTHEAFLATGFADLSSGGSPACVPPPGSGSGAVSVSAAVSGLHAGAEYDFRLVATNANGTTPGSALSFATDPIAFTDAATTVHHTDAVLNGHFDPSGDAGITNCQFDWGTDTTYSGGSVPCAQGNSFPGPAEVSATLGNLAPGTTYHFRLDVSTTSHGDSTGHDQSVTPSQFPIAGGEELATFGPDGTSGSSFPSFLQPLAFDQSSRHLYAHDSAAPGIYGFDASAPPAFPPLAGFAPLSTAPSGNNAALAVDNTALGSAGNVYYISSAFGEGGTGLVYGFNSAGTPLGGNFPIDTETNPGAPAGSPKGPYAAAVDPSGNLWIVSLLTQRVLEYSSAGVFQSSVDVSAVGNPKSAAFDSAGNLYVAGFGEQTRKYTAASGYATSTLVDSGTSTALAVDPSTDNLFVTHEHDFTEYSPSGTLLGTFATGIPNARFRGITVDATNHDVYVADDGNHRVRVFAPAVPQKRPTLTPGNPTTITGSSATLNAKVDPETFEVIDCHFDLVPDSKFQADGYASVTPEEQHACTPDPGSGSGDVAVHADLSGLNGGTTYHFRIVAANAQPDGSASGPDQSFASHGPAIAAEAVEAIGSADATLSAKINPEGEPSTYHVEYGTTSAYGQSSAESAPLGFSGDNSGHPVSVHIGALQPGTAYHFRFVATNPGGTDRGSDTTFSTYGAAPSFGPCPNDAYRTGPSAHLPDCRAYEQVTPIDKHGANVQGSYKNIQASSAGNRIDFLLLGGLPTTGGSSTLAPFLASRGAAGWSTDGLLPTTEPGGQAIVQAWSEDFSTSLSSAPTPGGSGAALFLRDSASGAFGQAGPSFPNLGERLDIGGFAADTSHLIFEDEGATLASGAAAGKDNLYELDHGNLTLAGRIPAGAATSCDDEAGPACVPAPEGSFAGPYDWKEGDLSRGGAVKGYYTQSTISRDGSRVFFTAGGTGRLYMREGGTRTTEVSASQRSAPDPNGGKPAVFLTATPDGSKVFFMSCEKLTDDSTAVSTAADTCASSSQGSDLYAYDTGTGALSDLSVDSDGNPRGADVQGILGASEDGSHVYFVANGVLAPGATPGACNIAGTGSGDCNLYLLHEGTTTFIASLREQLGAADASLDWAPKSGFGGEPKGSRIAADGGTALFISARSLTGYDNVAPGTKGCIGGSGIPGESCRELYRYSAADGGLECVSCNPTGLPPVGNAALASDHGALFGTALGFAFLTRNLSADGKRAFFETPDALLPSDTNGVRDVYEWEAKGSGSCESESQNGGCLYLVSSGRSPDPSYFGDASSNGDHVFVFTSQQLVPSDEDGLEDIYDAALGGGLAAQHALAPPTCSGTACQANPPPPPEQGTASSSFQGPGNAREGAKARKCPKGKRKVRRAGKVSCQRAHKAKQQKRHSNRGGSK